MSWIISRYPIAIILLLSVVIIYPLLGSGYFSHHDDLQVMRILEMRKCFADLQVPCRWVPDMGYGNGYPLFNYYPVLPYYLGSLFSFIVGYIWAAKLLFILPLVVGGLSMFLLARELFGEVSGLTAAVLYLFAPYRSVDSYVRGDVAESFSLMIIPLLFFFFLKLIRKNSLQNFIGSTLFLAAFLLSHNIMVMIFTPLFLGWILFWIIVERPKSYYSLVLSLFLGTGLSAFFLLPAFLEKNLVQVETLKQGALDFRIHFVTLPQLLLSRFWGYGASVWGSTDGLSFQIGWPHWILASAALIFSLTRVEKLKQSKELKTKFLLMLGVFGVFILSMFMTHNRSSLIWEKIELLQYAQFPWRFLSISIFCTGILGGFFVFLFPESKRILIACLIVLGTVILNWYFFRADIYYPTLTDQQKLTGQLWDTQRTASLLDYLPVGAVKPTSPAPDKPNILSGQAQVSKFRQGSNTWQFNALVSHQVQLELPIFDFPVWEIKAGNQEVAKIRDPSSGKVLIKLNPGDYLITGRLKDTPIRNIADKITLLSLLLFLAYCTIGGVAKKNLLGRR